MTLGTLEPLLKIVGAIAAIIGLFFTGYQIREANKALIFSTEQSIYRESRELLKFIAENPSLLRNASLSDSSKLSPEESIKLRAQVGILLNFYNAILQDRNAQFVSEAFRNRLISDFCGLVKLPQVKLRLPEKSVLPENQVPFETLASIQRTNCHE